jgi:hypothetical protein
LPFRSALALIALFSVGARVAALPSLAFLASETYRPRLALLTGLALFTGRTLIAASTLLTRFAFFSFFAIFSSLSFFTLQPNLSAFTALTLQPSLTLHSALSGRAVLHLVEPFRHLQTERVLELDDLGPQIGKSLIAPSLNDLQLTRPLPAQLHDDPRSGVKKRFGVVVARCAQAVLRG